MHTKREILSKIQSGSILLGILRLIGLLCLYKDVDKKRGHQYIYPTTVMLRCFVVRIWLRIPSNNCLHQYFEIDMPYNQKAMRACGLDVLPDRRTFDRRFKVLPIKQAIAKMGNAFFLEGIVDTDTASVDSSLLKARGQVWHKSSMKKNILPISGIDTDARWGFSKTRGWVFGYKLHMSCSTGNLVVPLSEGQRIYCTRKVSVESLFECLKETFGIGTLPARGLEMSASFVLSCVFVYQLAVYYNCITSNDRPRCVRRMLGN